MDPGHTAAVLVAGLEATWQMIEETLARLTPADLDDTFPPLTEAERDPSRVAGRTRAPAIRPDVAGCRASGRRAGAGRSRQWIIWGVLEHDIHHGSEISTTLGVHGLPVVDLD